MPEGCGHCCTYKSTKQLSSLSNILYKDMEKNIPAESLHLAQGIEVRLASILLLQFL